MTSTSLSNQQPVLVSTGESRSRTANSRDIERAHPRSTSTSSRLTTTSCKSTTTFHKATATSYKSTTSPCKSNTSSRQMISISRQSSVATTTRATYTTAKSIKHSNPLFTVAASIASTYCSCIQTPRISTIVATFFTTLTTTSTQVMSSTIHQTTTITTVLLETVTQTRFISLTNTVTVATRTYSNSMPRCTQQDDKDECSEPNAEYCFCHSTTEGEKVCVRNSSGPSRNCDDSCSCTYGQVCLAGRYYVCVGADNNNACPNPRAKGMLFGRKSTVDEWMS